MSGITVEWIGDKGRRVFLSQVRKILTTKNTVGRPCAVGGDLGLGNPSCNPPPLLDKISISVEGCDKSIGSLRNGPKVRQIHLDSLEWKALPSDLPIYLRTVPASDDLSTHFTVSRQSKRPIPPPLPSHHTTIVSEAPEFHLSLLHSA
jgi:hypothetical protein